MKAPARGPGGPDLQARALRWLAQREHSRVELRGKLLRAARPRLSSHVGADAEGEPDDAPAQQALQARIDTLLDLLQAKGLLSDERFVESRLRVRASGVGTRRLEAELARHHVELQASQRRHLQGSELQRAVELWARRFGAPADDPKALARQMRFLAGRGFAHDVIRQAAAELRRRARDTAP